MTNQGAKTASLNAGGSYTIPAGYHNGSGKVTANSLASQTEATLPVVNHPMSGAPNHSQYMANGETAWVNGVKITGLAQIANSSSFSVFKTANEDSISLANTSPYNYIFPRIARKIPYDSIARVIQLNSSQIVKGQTVLGIVGTG